MRINVNFLLVILAVVSSTVLSLRGRGRGSGRGRGRRPKADAKKCQNACENQNVWSNTYNCQNHCMRHSKDGSWGSESYYVEDSEDALDFCERQNWRGRCRCDWVATENRWKCNLTSNGDFQGNMLIATRDGKIISYYTKWDNTRG